MTAGARQSTTPATGVLTASRRAARGRAADTLYVLIDLNGDTASSVLDELKRRITDAYWSMPGSVTSALRAAITAGGEWLMDRNTTTPVADRQTGGMTCAVLRGTEVYIAQAGLACAYVTQHGSIERLPAPDAEPMPPLGMSRANDIRFAHAELQPGDGLLLTDARAPSRIPIESIASAMVDAGIETALRNLEHLAGDGDLIALLVQVAATPETIARPVEPAPLIAVERPTSPAPVRSTSTPSKATPATPSTSVVTPIARSTQPVKTESAPVETVTPPREPRTATARAWLSALALGVRRGFGSVGTAGQALAQRTLPESTIAQRRGARTASSNHTPMMAGIAIGIPIVVSLLFVTIFIQRSTQAEVEAQLAEAQNEITAASPLSGAAARVHWQSAIDKANEALQLAPDNAAATQYIAQAQAALDQIDHVTRVKPMVLYDFKSLGQHRLALQGYSMFALDRGSNQIDRLTLNAAGDGIEGGGPEHIYSPGMSIDNKVPGNLIDQVWVSAGEKRQTNALIVLHQNGLFEYELTFGLNGLDFGTNTAPSGAQRLRSYMANLYILDPAASQIWRYSPKDNAYTEPAQPYFVQPVSGTTKAIDMAIDGNIYVLGSDGQIAKYLGGDAEAFQINGLAEPLRQPVAIAVDTNVPESSVWVADQSGRRIVQLRPDGQFVRQFRADGPAFDAIEDMMIDEQNHRLFVVSGGVLYTVQLPPVQ